MLLDGGAVEKPMLGRYQVDKELGKGAMGVVLASFADEQAAQQLAEHEGGRVLRFAEIDQHVLQMGASMDTAHEHASLDPHAGH